MPKISTTQRLVAMSALGAALVLGGGSAFAQTDNGSGENGSGEEGTDDNGSGENGSGTDGGTDTGGDETAAPPADDSFSSLPNTGAEALVTLGAAGALVTLAGAARRAALRS